MPGMPPAIENDPAVEWLSFGGDHYTIALLPGAGVCFAPMQLNGGKIQCIETHEQVLCPLETETALPDSAVDEKIIEKRRPDDAIIASELARLRAVDIRDFATDRHRSTDDYPYGGGQGMVMRPEPLVAAVESVRRPSSRLFQLSPSGRRFDQRGEPCADPDQFLPPCGRRR